ncbi:MAG: lipoprotein insertase outer membrane protein LolB [Gammaproteobacteria bacterium]|nr:lipoprotein insertase outer membrane protein LolB [Gammaproteobacteria bacterium]
MACLLSLSRFCLPAVLVSLLSGCSTPPVALHGNMDPRELWDRQKAVNSTLTSWYLHGKIGVKTGKKGGSATLKWNYLPDGQKIDLYGPFGGGRVRITAGTDSAVLKDNQGRVIEGRSAQEVLYRRLGWQVPFNELVLWSRGLHDEEAEDVRIDAAGRLKSLNQGIWHVEYQEYRTVNHLVLPRKLTISLLPDSLEIYDDDGNYIGDELNVKVIFQRWRDIVAG